MTNPINLSIGQPHFDTSDEIKEAMKQAEILHRRLKTEAADNAVTAMD